MTSKNRIIQKPNSQIITNESIQVHSKSGASFSTTSGQVAGSFMVYAGQTKSAPIPANATPEELAKIHANQKPKKRHAGGRPRLGKGLKQALQASISQETSEFFKSELARMLVGRDGSFKIGNALDELVLELKSLREKSSKRT